MNTNIIRRAGLIILGLPALADVASLPLTDGEHPPYPIAVLATVAAVAGTVVVLTGVGVMMVARGNTAVVAS